MRSRNLVIQVRGGKIVMVDNRAYKRFFKNANIALCKIYSLNEEGKFAIFSELAGYLNKGESVL